MTWAHHSNYVITWQFFSANKSAGFTDWHIPLRYLFALSWFSERLNWFRSCFITILLYHAHYRQASHWLSRPPPVTPCELIQLYVTWDHDVTPNTFQKSWLHEAHCTALPADIREVTVHHENRDLWHRDFLLWFEEALSTSSPWLGGHNPTMASTGMILWPGPVSSHPAPCLSWRGVPCVQAAPSHSGQPLSLFYLSWRSCTHPLCNAVVLDVLPHVSFSNNNCVAGALVTPACFSACIHLQTGISGWSISTLFCCSLGLSC